MTLDEATGLMGQLMVAFPADKVSDQRSQLYLGYLTALPLNRGQRAIERLIATTVSAFVPPIAAIVAEAGVYGEAIDQLTEAVRTRQQLVPDLGSMSGWAVGTARIPLPPPRPEVLAFPVPFLSEEERTRLAGRFGDLVGTLGKAHRR